MSEPDKYTYEWILKNFKPFEAVSGYDAKGYLETRYYGKRDEELFVKNYKSLLETDFKNLEDAEDYLVKDNDPTLENCEKALFEAFNIEELSKREEFREEFSSDDPFLVKCAHIHAVDRIGDALSKSLVEKIKQPPGVSDMSDVYQNTYADVRIHIYDSPYLDKNARTAAWWHGNNSKTRLYILYANQQYIQDTISVHVHKIKRFDTIEKCKKYDMEKERENCETFLKEYRKMFPEKYFECSK